MIDIKNRCNFYFIPYIRFMFGLVYCPDCGKRMKRVEYPYEPVFQCECGWTTFHVVSKKHIAQLAILATYQNSSLKKGEN